MVTVPAGSYTMGSPAAEAGRHADEAQRRVTIEDPFAVGVYEVTFAEWDACAAAGGWGRGRQPVIDVSWDDAQAYVAWLSSKTGEEYRLLTEAEWEYVARAGTITPFLSIAIENCAFLATENCALSGDARRGPA